MNDDSTYLSHQLCDLCQITLIYLRFLPHAHTDTPS